jgi:abortive infection bacteriophage resistance protein
MITEIMTLGELVKLFRGAPKPVKADIANRFGVTDDVMQNWLMSLNRIRNICAHHGRLWNRKLDYTPMIPKKDPRWHDPVEVKGERVFGILTVLRYLLDDVAPQSLWTVRLEALLGAYPGIPRVSMGFPEDWAFCPFWVLAEASAGPAPDIAPENE